MLAVVTAIYHAAVAAHATYLSHINCLLIGYYTADKHYNPDAVDLVFVLIEQDHALQLVPLTVAVVPQNLIAVVLSQLVVE